MTKRIRFIITPLIIGAFISCKNTSDSKLPGRPVPPNVIIILADDQGWGDLSYNGNANLNTPNIDALAKEGVSFEHFYVQPVCSPTRAEFLTGRHFPRLGVYSTSAGGERFNLGETTIAEVFKKAGYRTAAYGKWHSGMQPPYHPNARGFDDYYGFASGHWGNYFSPMLEHNGEPVRGNGFLVDDLTTKGLEFISRHSNEPFLLYLPLNTPHSPMQVPDAFWARFKNRELKMRYRDSTLENKNFTRAALAMVENIDHNVGRVRRKLQELNLDDNTIVVYFSDNGPNGWRWNGGMRGKKGSTDEGGVRTPFFIRWKDRLPAGKKIGQIASAIDILPTLTSLAGIQPDFPKPLDGKNLYPLLIADTTIWADRVVYNHWNGKTSIRTEKYRLDHEDRLYDMISDPGQRRPLTREHLRILDSLKQLKADWLMEVGSDIKKDEARPFPLGHPDYTYTQLPSRDGIPHGNIRRSSRHPNDSFFTQWKTTNDSISWDVEVLGEGQFEVVLYYTCRKQDVGATLQLRFGDSEISSKITEYHDPPLTGMENDRDPRIESYVKDFSPMSLGIIKLKKGRGPLTLKALEIPGKEAVDVRLLLFKRLE